MSATAEPPDWSVPASELARRIRLREVSAVEVLEAQLARIEAHNGAVGAVVSLDADAAREQAATADADLARGRLRGPLHGVPMTLKDAHDVAGMRTTVGTAELDAVPARDGTVAARLRAAGAVITGHTNVPPWLADHQCANPIFGRTSNPWDLGRTAGGSSGGAAAAVAVGMSALEVGSDLAGSLRLPAHCCGVHSLRTTEHRVPATGFFRPPGGGPRPVRVMGSIGPVARSLTDLELALSLLAGPDLADTDVPPVPLRPTAPLELSELRLAVAPALPGLPVAQDLRAEVLRVAAAARAAGARVDEVLPDVDWDDQLALFGELLTTLTGAFTPGAPTTTLAAHLVALHRRDAVVATWENFLAGYDALLVPPALRTAVPHGPGPVLIDGEPVDPMLVGAPYAFSSLAGLPALVLPAGQDADGLPIGVELVGRRWSETRLLEVGAALEDAGILPGFRPPPRY